MKRLSFTLLLSLPLCSFSQSYLTFHKERPAYYSFAYNYEIFYQQAGISIDSFHVNGSDTTFFHYPIIDNDNSNGCYLKAHDTSFVGFQSIRTSNGDDEFFNRTGDTIYFKNDAAPSESWTMLQLGAGNKIIATVQSINVESVLGIDDSVKTISLQEVDDLGNNIANIFNSKIFKIGKSFGFVKGYSLFHFPNDTIGFSIVGIENPSIGLSSENLTPLKVFDFDVGDRFDYLGSAVTEPTYHFNSYLTKKIISKEVSTNGDTLTYQVESKYFNQTHSFYDYWENSGGGVGDEKHIISESGFLNVKSGQWSVFISDNEGGPVSLIPSIYPASSTAKNFYDDYFNLNGNCLTEVIWGVGPGNIQYAIGLGKTSEFYGQWDWNHGNALVYYNKNGVEWGDSIDWNAVGISSVKNQKGILAFPNPTSDQIFVKGNFSASLNQFTLLNSFGQEMKLNMISRNSSSVSFDVGDLPPGFYVLQIRKEDEVQNMKFVKN